MIYFGYFSLSLIHLDLRRQISLYALVVPLKTISESGHNGQNLYPFSDQNGAAHTYIDDMWEYTHLGWNPALRSACS